MRRLRERSEEAYLDVIKFSGLPWRLKLTAQIAAARRQSVGEALLRELVQAAPWKNAVAGL